jgi:GTP-binding protein of the ras superfamily involved in termination of M-phase
VSMMPMVCVDAVAILFMFDLTQRPTLSSVREWYRQVRGLNKNALPFLVGTKYDLFYAMDKAEQEVSAARLCGTGGGRLGGSE